MIFQVPFYSSYTSTSQDMLSPAMLKSSLSRRTSFRESRSAMLEPVEEFHASSYASGRRKSAPTIDPLEEEEEIASLFGSSSTSRKSSNMSQSSYKRRDSGASRISIREELMFSPKSSFFGTASVLQKGLEEERRRMSDDRRGSMAMGRRRSSAVGAAGLGLGGVFATAAAEAQLPGQRVKVQPHQYTEDPTVAWEMLKSKRPVRGVRQMKVETPIRPDHVRFVCVSCTHGAKLEPDRIPPGDVLIIAGDFTSCGLPKEVKNFNSNLAHLKHPYKIVIGGNHECTFDEAFLRSTKRDIGEAKEFALKQALTAALAAMKISDPTQLITNAIYLQDSVIELFGITIYGTPWQPRIDNWAFNLPRGQPLLDKWNQIPAGVDVLITHTPPLGHGDRMHTGQRMGCVELLNSVTKRIKPKYHVFGHIHEGYGCTSDGYTKFINCCLTDENLDMVNNPVIFDMPVHPNTKHYYLNNTKKILKRFAKQK